MDLTKNLQEQLNAHLQSFGIKELNPTVSKLLIKGAEDKAKLILKGAEAKAVQAASTHIKGITLKRIFKELEEVSKKVPNEDTSPKPEETSGKSGGAPAPKTGVPPASGGANAPKIESGAQGAQLSKGENSPAPKGGNPTA